MAISLANKDANSRARPAMRPGIVETFLHNPEQRGFDMCGRPSSKGYVERHILCGPALLSQLAQGRRKPQIIERRRTHSGNHVAQFADQCAGLLRRKPKVRRVAIRRQIKPASERRSALRHPVMQFMRNPPALGFLSAQQFSQQRGKPRLAQSCRKCPADQLGQNAERFAIIGSGSSDALFKNQRAYHLSAASGCFERHNEAAIDRHDRLMGARNTASRITGKVSGLGSDPAYHCIEFVRIACC